MNYKIVILLFLALTVSFTYGMSVSESQGDAIATLLHAINQKSLWAIVHLLLAIVFVGYLAFAVTYGKYRTNIALLVAFVAVSLFVTLFIFMGNA